MFVVTVVVLKIKIFCPKIYNSETFPNLRLSRPLYIYTNLAYKSSTSNGIGRNFIPIFLAAVLILAACALVYIWMQPHARCGLCWPQFHRPIPLAISRSGAPYGVYIYVAFQYRAEKNIKKNSRIGRTSEEQQNNRKHIVEGLGADRTVAIADNLFTEFIYCSSNSSCSFIVILLTLGLSKWAIRSGNLLQQSKFILKFNFGNE